MIEKIKVFGLGLGKTGTSTLAKALEILGYKTHDGDLSLVKPYINGELDIFYKLVDEYDAFEDEPWCFLYKELDEKYPDSKFILTIRNSPEQWIRSKINHETNTGKKGIYNCVYYNQLCYGLPHVINNEDEFMNFYNTHNKNVIKYFKNKNLIVINWKNDSGWAKLCSFLDEDIPDEEFPHMRKGDFDGYKRIVRIASKYPDKYYPTFEEVEEWLDV